MGTSLGGLGYGMGAPLVGGGTVAGENGLGVLEKFPA